MNQKIAVEFADQSIDWECHTPCTLMKYPGLLEGLPELGLGVNRSQKNNPGLLTLQFNPGIHQG